MTARGGRAARRADPGAAADRRDIVGKRQDRWLRSYPAVDWRVRNKVGAASGAHFARRPPRLEDRARRPGATETRLAPFDGDLLSAGAGLASFEDVVRELWVREGLNLLHNLEFHRGSHAILFLLSFGKETTAYQMRKHLQVGQFALEGSIAVLRREGLIELGDAMPFPRSRARAYRLTQRGNILATRLHEALGVITNGASRV